jgi:hypothetical protein
MVRRASPFRVSASVSGLAEAVTVTADAIANITIAGARVGVISGIIRSDRAGAMT